MTNAFRSLSQTMAFGANADEFIKNYPHQNQTLNPIQLHRVIDLSLTKEADDITEMYAHGLCAAYCEATLDNLSDECHGKLTVLYAGGIPVHFLANVTHNNKTVFIDAYGAYENITDIAKRYQETTVDQIITVDYYGEDDNQQIEELREATVHLIDEFDIEGESEAHNVHYTEFYDDFLSTLFAHNIATIVAEHDRASHTQA